MPLKLSCLPRFSQFSQWTRENVCQWILRKRQAFPSVFNLATSSKRPKSDTSFLAPHFEVTKRKLCGHFEQLSRFTIWHLGPSLTYDSKLFSLALSNSQWSQMIFFRKLRTSYSKTLQKRTTCLFGLFRTLFILGFMAGTLHSTLWRMFPCRFTHTANWHHKKRSVYIFARLSWHSNKFVFLSAVEYRISSLWTKPIFPRTL